jgi:hypothetical protein
VLKVDHRDTVKAPALHLKDVLSGLGLLNEGPVELQAQGLIKVLKRLAVVLLEAEVPPLL